MYDVVIIGAGVSGAASARELSKYNLSVCVVDKEEDVCCGTSKANSAIVHSGIDCQPGTLMAEMNVKGNELIRKLHTELDFEFKQNGSLIVCFSEEDRPNLEALYERGIKNGVPDLRILDSKEVHEMEPNLSDEVVEAVKNKKFHIYTVSTIEEGIEILTGVPAGKKDKNGKFPAGTVNHLAYEKLKNYAKLSKEL